ncbi:NAD(P)/FAD-dependent oxidoreductase [Bordetella hinzii]|jgi:sarcosine oxidase subunit beta|uniref:FAD dependent oxidoreductase n=1 Tax=Bordetella hinzii OH87 BAL007II TaxID=1331262 RepID=A0ABR4QWT1_9BORD|nr:FAD-dependent oxidoreductase [Bordetella hinzii]AKQ54014.1 4-methylaminobutanoate oxidase (formaldehyde-forming) [Bordetella hinzii]KCB22462.1 FAD dependent oxidoreductase [Bordetella hinzii OH87 BAL007II]KCB29384.1 FAD dependent oxidoreductase [Bordetella hinzii CA90 BAL1384]KCB33725.1 FAD dependent oxidoreductase [Bordetella hinzii L60]KCB41913.1 FAD dependent oxidoreductase [Bordetella hinzii 5132]
MSIETEVLIIGGGIVGASAALFLRRRGLPVILLDMGACGARASGVNYGGVRRQGRPLAQMPLTARAHELWGQLPSLIGTHGEYVRSGHLKLARTEQDLDELRAYRERTEGWGMDLRILPADALRRRFAWLDPGLAGGSFCPEDGHANPRLVSPAFAQAAIRAGADVREQQRVVQTVAEGRRFVVRTASGETIRARFLLNCAGAWGGEIAAAFGEPVPETAIHPLMMVTEPLPAFMDVSLGIQGGGIYARQVARGNCVIGGGRGALQSDGFARPSRKEVPALLARAAALLPPLRGAQVIRFWTGVEGSMPDHNPVLGPSSKVPGLFHAFGLSGAGFQIGPAVGEVLSQLVVDGVSSLPIDAFRIERYTAAAHAAESQSSREHTLE